MSVAKVSEGQLSVDSGLNALTTSLSDHDIAIDPLQVDALVKGSAIRSAS